MLANDGLDITLRDGFEFWLDEESADPEIKASLERANGSIFPTVQLAAAPAAYWCRFPDKAHVRWVLADDEDTALAALSRLAKPESSPSARVPGSPACSARMDCWCRCGICRRIADAPEWEEPMVAFAERYATALAAGADP